MKARQQLSSTNSTQRRVAAGSFKVNAYAMLARSAGNQRWCGSVRRGALRRRCSVLQAVHARVCVLSLQWYVAWWMMHFGRQRRSSAKTFATCAYAAKFERIASKGLQGTARVFTSTALMPDEHAQHKAVVLLHQVAEI
jgi:hypothetical protein